jgi:pimeloyl-[acyl-carrier protein] methyl ester esterase
MLRHETGLSIFLLRGLAREVRHWGTFVEALGTARRHIDVIPLEMPGAGVFRDRKSPLRTEEYVSQMRLQYLQQAKPGKPCIITGLSFGGMIAAQWVHTHPDDFQGAILINSSSRNSFPTKRLTPGGALAFLRALFTRDVFTRERIIAALLCNLADVGQTASLWAAIEKSAPMAASNKIRQLFAAATFVLPGRGTVPALILCSKNDKLVSPACSHSIAREWQSEIHTHPSAGHDLTTDDANWCIEGILSWLDSLP